MEIQIFKNERFGEVRTMVINDEPWFVGKDVASVLGYQNASKAVMVHVEEEDKNTELLEAHSQNGNLSKTKTILINESGLYSLILSSKLPQTREFKRRVTSEVLGQTRKMGGYIPINGCDLVLWFYSSIIFRDTHTIRIVRCGSPSYASSSLRLIKLK